MLFFSLCGRGMGWPLVWLDSSHSVRMDFIWLMGELYKQSWIPAPSLYRKRNVHTVVELESSHREGLISFHNGRITPFINGNPKLVSLQTHFSVNEKFRVREFSSFSDGFHFIHGGDHHFDKREPQSFNPANSLFRKLNVHTVIEFNSSHRALMDFISFMRDHPSSERKPQSFMPETHF